MSTKQTTTDKTIRLKKQEAIDLKEQSFILTKKAIMSGHQKLYKESDVVHYLLENMAKYVIVNENTGELGFNVNLLIKEQANM